MEFKIFSHDIVPNPSPYTYDGEELSGGCIFTELSTFTLNMQNTLKKKKKPQNILTSLMPRMLWPIKSGFSGLRITLGQKKIEINIAAHGAPYNGI